MMRNRRCGSTGVILRDLGNGKVEVQVTKDNAWHKKGDIVIWRTKDA